MTIVASHFLTRLRKPGVGDTRGRSPLSLCARLSKSKGLSERLYIVVPFGPAAERLHSTPGANGFPLEHKGLCWTGVAIWRRYVSEWEPYLVNAYPIWTNTFQSTRSLRRNDLRLSVEVYIHILPEFLPETSSESLCYVLMTHPTLT